MLVNAVTKDEVTKEFQESSVLVFDNKYYVRLLPNNLIAGNLSGNRRKKHASQYDLMLILKQAGAAFAPKLDKLIVFVRPILRSEA